MDRTRLPRVLLAVFLAAPLGQAQLSTFNNQYFRQGGALPDQAENNDSFGYDVAAGDFNGDGWADLAVSAPGEDDAKGVVHVIQGGPDGLIGAGSQRWRQGSDGVEGNDEDNDQFGIALVAGDFNGDNFDDLAIGVSGEDGFRGVVHVLYGSAGGLAAAAGQVWDQNDLAGGGRDAGDAFGSSLAAGDFNGDGRDDLAVGSVGEQNSSGLAHVIYGSQGGLTANGNLRLRQSADGISGIREPGDSFAFELAAGDFNGDGFADLAIGVPGEDNAKGRIVTILGFGGGLDTSNSRNWEQGSNGVPGDDENGDAFGAVLTAGDTNGDGFDELVIASTGENQGKGDVVVLFGSPNGPAGPGSQQWRQGENGFPDEQEDGDRFGSALVIRDFNFDGFGDLAIGVRGEDGNAGILHALYGGPAGLTLAGNQIFAQGFNGAQDRADSGDDFGFSVAAGNFGLDPASDLAVSARGDDNDRGSFHIFFGEAADAPMISAVVGAGLSQPFVQTLSPNQIITLFGLNFTADGVFRQAGQTDLVNGRLPTNLDNVCMEVAGTRAPLFGLFGIAPNQINAQSNIRPQDVAALRGQNAPAIVRVIVNCGLGDEIASEDFIIGVAPAAPEFFFFNDLDDDRDDPIAAVNETTFKRVAPAGLIPNAFPAQAGDVVTIYMTGLGDTSPRLEPGEIPAGAAATVLPVAVTIGGVAVEVFYAGISPGFAGLYQVSFGIPPGLVGNQAVVVQVGDLIEQFTTGPGGFIAVQ